RGAWGGLIPNDSSALLPWLIEQSDERLMLMLAQYVAASVDGVATNEAPHAINALIPALGLNLADAWQPTKASYFDHVSKQRIVEVVSAAVSPAEGLRLSKLKKGDAATEAERLVATSGWLPEHFARAETVRVALWDRAREADRLPDESGDGGTAGDEKFDASVDPEADSAVAQ
ncbi:hypothetical protein DFQ30_002518, partial [Apophysomyces sp. BC1015]